MGIPLYLEMRGYTVSLFGKIFNKLNISYISFVYKTSKITTTGAVSLITDGDYIVSFWHGDSYPLYPLLKGKRQFILTTRDKRGDYISALCEYFGYSTIRLPDTYDDGKHIQRIKKTLNDAGGGNLVITLDGPLGPYHEPKEFPFFMGLILGKPMIAVSVKAKRSIRLIRRWDNYTIPLPFNTLEFHFHDPVEIGRPDLKDKFTSKERAVREMMEEWENTGKKTAESGSAFEAFQTPDPPILGRK